MAAGQRMLKFACMGKAAQNHLEHTLSFCPIPVGRVGKEDCHIAWRKELRIIPEIHLHCPMKHRRNFQLGVQMQGKRKTYPLVYKKVCLVIFKKRNHFFTLSAKNVQFSISSVAYYNRTAVIMQAEEVIFLIQERSGF